MDDSLRKQVIAAVAVMAGLFGTGFIFGCRWQATEAAEARTELAQQRENHAIQLADATTVALNRERDLTQKFSKTAEANEQGKQDAKRKSDKVAADLRSDALRLRRAWAGCETRRLSAASAGAAIADGLADDRAASAGRIVRAAAGCDAQVKGLQDILRAERQ